MYCFTCCSLQRRTNLWDLDNEAVAFKSVLGSMLARVYNNPQRQDDSQTRVEKILHFWGSKEVYDQETIANFEREMKGGLAFPSVPRHVSPDPTTFSGNSFLFLNYHYYTSILSRHLYKDACFLGFFYPLSFKPFAIFLF
jgi:hypothetical protein